MKKIILALLLFGNLAAAMPAQILLMRHGEKPDTGPELNEMGWQRARALPGLFRNRPEFLKFGKPVALYAMKPKHEGGSVRAIQTLQFVAEDLRLQIDTDFNRDEYKDMLRQIQQERSLDGKSIVISWEHDVLEEIAQSLGAPKTKWPGSQFDRIWILSFDSNGQFKKMENLPEKLLPTDSKN